MGMHRDTPEVQLARTASAYAIHTLTASGVACAFFSLTALFDGDMRTCMLWLIGSLIIDGIDGPIARKFGIMHGSSRLDGDLLDLVVDYLTFILIPALFLWKFDLLPENISTLLTVAMLMVGALWSARKDMKTSDKWFNSFPAAWNFLAISLWLLGTPQIFNAVIMIIFMGLCATNVKFLHIFRSTQFRQFTVSFTMVYLAAVVYMITFESQRHNNVGRVIIAAWFVYYLALAYWRTWVYREDLYEDSKIISVDHNMF